MTTPPGARPGVLGTGVPARTLALIAAVAVVVRVVVHAMVDFQMAGDVTMYDLLARNLLEHHTFSRDAQAPWAPTLYRPPGYPAFQALLYGVFGYHQAVVRLAQHALGAGTALALARASERHAPATGPWVLWLLAVCPFDAVYASALLSESLCAALLSLAMVAWVSWAGARRFAVAGVLLGLCTLVRDIHIAFLPFLGALWVLFGPETWRRRVGQAALFGLCAALTIAPWTLRNHAVSGRWVPTSAGRLGFSLWTGSWVTSTAQIRDYADGRRVYAREAFLDEAERVAVEDCPTPWSAEQDVVYRQMFARRMREQPARVVGRWFYRAPQLWLGTRFDVFNLQPSVLPYGSLPWKLVKVGFFGLNTLYVALGFAGAALAVRRRSALGWWSAPLLFTALVYFPLNSFENRYSMPCYPLLVALGAGAAHALVRWWRQRRGQAQIGSTTTAS